MMLKYAVSLIFLSNSGHLFIRLREVPLIASLSTVQRLFRRASATVWLLQILGETSKDSWRKIFNRTPVQPTISPEKCIVLVQGLTLPCRQLILLASG